jgi:YD repeat-containing protein
MSPRLFDGLRSEWRLRRGVANYVEKLGTDPDDVDVTWLAATATTGDLDRARWELRYARRALGLLVAQRDALDDRTGSAVAHELARALHNDPNVAAGMVRVAERQFGERLGSYREVLSAREAREGTGGRLGRALLRMSGATVPAGDDAVQRASEILVRYVSEANATLRQIFGMPALPEDVPPSALLRDRGI